jgi:citrate synthase
MRKFLEGFRYDAHPMAMLNSSVAGLAAFYPTASHIFDETERNISIIRLLAKTPTIAAFSYRHVKGLPFVYPDNRLSYVENFLSMVARMSESKYEANPVFARALEILFILHADHEQNCSTNAVRAVGSSHVDPFSAVSAGVAALFGPLHGGANEQVLRMISEIGSVKNVPAFIETVKSGEGGRLMEFGHRVYKSHDPRAKIIKKQCDDLLAELKVSDPLLDIAMRLEQAALHDPYFIERKLYPNVDFYSGIMMRAIGIPLEMFTVIFAIGRIPGWIANYREVSANEAGRICRPRQIYVGEPLASYVPIDQRPA